MDFASNQDFVPVDASATNWVTRLQEHCQKAKWPLPRYADDPTQPFADTPFQMAVVIDVPEGALAATGLPAANKKKARQQAAQAMIELGEFQAALASSVHLSAHSKAAAAPVAENYVSRLNEKCQQWKLDRPVYVERAREGPPHEPRFVMEVSITMRGREMAPSPSEQRSAIGASAPSMAQARHLAASALLEQLRKNGELT